MKKIILLSVLLFSFNGWAEVTYLKCEHSIGFYKSLRGCSDFGCINDDGEMVMRLEEFLFDDRTYAIDDGTKNITEYQAWLPLDIAFSDEDIYQGDLTIPYTEKDDYIEFTYRYRAFTQLFPYTKDDYYIEYHKHIFQINRINGRMFQTVFAQIEGYKEWLFSEDEWQCKNTEPLF